MTGFNPDLARRFAGLPLAPGMRVLHPAFGECLVLAVHDGRALLVHVGPDERWGYVATALGWRDISLLLPDYRDPGTLGHILAAVRKAWGDLTANPHRDVASSHWCIRLRTPRWEHYFGASEAECLAAAWEARPGREGIGVLARWAIVGGAWAGKAWHTEMDGEPIDKAAPLPEATR